MIGSWSALPSSAPTSASSRRRSRSYATRTADRSPPSRGDAVSSSSPTGSKLAGQGRAQRGQGVEVACEVAQERAPVVGDDRGQSRGGIEGLGDLEELARFEPAAPNRPTDGRSDVTRGPDAGPRPLVEEVARLVGLVEPAGHDDRVAGRLEGLGQPPGRTERGGGRQPALDGRELEQAE